MRFLSFLLFFLVSFSLGELVAKPSTINRVMTPLYTYKGDVFAAVLIPKNIQKKILAVY